MHGVDWPHLLHPAALLLRAALAEVLLHPLGHGGEELVELDDAVVVRVHHREPATVPSAIPLHRRSEAQGVQLLQVALCGLLLGDGLEHCDD